MRNRQVMGRTRKKPEKNRENQIVRSKHDKKNTRAPWKSWKSWRPFRGGKSWTRQFLPLVQATQATLATAKSPKVAVHEAIATAILFSQAIRVPVAVDFWANFRIKILQISRDPRTKDFVKAWVTSIAKPGWSRQDWDWDLKFEPSFYTCSYPKEWITRFPGP